MLPQHSEAELDVSRRKAWLADDNGHQLQLYAYP
jgi:hypothetical protein